MSTAQRIQELLDCAVNVPIRDAAGVITPAGIDAAARVEAIGECLKIAREEDPDETA